MMSISRLTTTQLNPAATALANKLLTQADLLERTRTSLTALWWDCEDTYERALIDAISLSFGLYSEDLCIEAAQLLGKPKEAAPEHVDRSGVVVRVNSIRLLMDLLEQGYTELCKDASSVGALSNQQCKEFFDMHAAFVTLFGQETGVILESVASVPATESELGNMAVTLIQDSAKPMAA